MGGHVPPWLNLKNYIKWPLLHTLPTRKRLQAGDPISPYLFIICSEILALAIKKDKKLEGTKLSKKEHKLSQYADDTTVFLKASEKNLKLCLKILQWFYEISGLKINIKKIKVIQIGSI